MYGAPVIRTSDDGRCPQADRRGDRAPRLIGVRPSSPRPRGGRLAGWPRYLAGLLLVAWIAVQLLILRRYFFLQPVIAGIGAAEVLLAWRWQRAAGAAGPGGSSPGRGTNASDVALRPGARLAA